MQDEYNFSAGQRGAPGPLPGSKTRLTIRLDDAVIDWFRERAEQQGGNYQTMINQALRDHIDHPALEGMLRRVVREELRNSG